MRNGSFLSHFLPFLDAHLLPEGGQVPVAELIALFRHQHTPTTLPSLLFHYRDAKISVFHPREDPDVVLRNLLLDDGARSCASFRVLEEDADLEALSLGDDRSTEQVSAAVADDVVVEYVCGAVHGCARW